MPLIDFMSGWVGGSSERFLRCCTYAWVGGWDELLIHGWVGGRVDVPRGE